MYIRLGFDIRVRVPHPTPMILLLHTRPELASIFRTPETLHVEPQTPITEYLDSFGNRCTRLVAPVGELRLTLNSLIENSGEPDVIVPDAMQSTIENLPPECLQYLLPSRYCEVDKLSGFAWDTFGTTNLGWSRVQAVNEYVHRHIEFGYAYADATKTAVGVWEEKRGVCRDYQHLAVTLCRCLGIPARYATGYIGDIRVPPTPGAMDFSAWYQVYLGGRWYDFDARYNTPRVGRTLMAVGRDAADVALMTTFGRHTLEQFLVIDEEVSDEVALAEIALIS